MSDLGKGYLDTPSIYTDAHVEGWKKITDAVHAGGWRIFCQLWHVGRISHVSLLPDRQRVRAVFTVNHVRIAAIKTNGVAVFVCHQQIQIAVSVTCDANFSMAVTIKRNFENIDFATR